jgi:hypothetical protein
MRYSLIVDVHFFFHDHREQRSFAQWEKESVECLEETAVVVTFYFFNPVAASGLTCDFFNSPDFFPRDKDGPEYGKKINFAGKKKSGELKKSQVNPEAATGMKK